MSKYLERTKPTNKLHIENLTKLAELLESNKIPPPRFHMGEYATKINLAKHKNLTEEKVNEIISFGTPFDRCFTTNNNFDFEYLSLHRLKEEDYKSCGTVCCALGHGPMAGIPVGDDYSSWEDYCFYNFGVDVSSPEYDWLFHANWAYVDNTPKGAAKRIRIYLKYGVPKTFKEQLLGSTPLMYKV